jgi:L-arabinokinase
MMNLCAHFGLTERIQPLVLAEMCREVETRLIGRPCSIAGHLACLCGRTDSLLRLLCQGDELQPPLRIPIGVRAVGIDSGVRRGGGGEYARTRCAAFMGHKIILEKMRDMGRAAGKSLNDDPMRGYLANLDPADYKRYFRPFLPEWMEGKAFLGEHGAANDVATGIEPSQKYPVQSATDHHVLDARRVRNFVTFIEETGALPDGSLKRRTALNKAGHLMYASHISYTRDALMGADECDLLVELVRNRERAGFYGARISAGGCGGTVAVLCDIGQGVDAAIGQIMREYQQRTGREPRAFLGAGPGAWETGTFTINT